jgi:hypothetical protein
MNLSVGSLQECKTLFDAYSSVEKGDSMKQMTRIASGSVGN